MLHSLPARADDGALPPDCRWIDLIDPTDEERALVRRVVGVETPTFEELREIEATSRLRSEGDTLRMSAPLLSGTDTGRWAIAPVGFILTPAVCVTVRFVELAPFDSAGEAIRSNPNVTPPEILTRLLEEVVDRAADHLERAAEIVNDTSQSVFFDEPKHRQLSKDTALLRHYMRRIGQVSDRTARVRYAFLSIGRIAAFVIDRCTPRIEDDVRDRLEAIRRDIRLA